MLDEEQLSQLQEKASSVLQNPSSHRPVFIEFAGTPKSGKSTCIDIVNHFFRRMDYKVLAPSEGASKRTPYYLKEDLVSFNVWSATYALSHILEGRYGTDQYDIAILDRGLFDALAWFELLKSEGDITTEERNTIHDFLLIDRWREVIDLVFLFIADPDTSLKRENQNKLVHEPGKSMNTDFLLKLNSAYTDVQENHSARFRMFHVINTSSNQNTTAESTAYEVTTQILDIMAKPE